MMCSLVGAPWVLLRTQSERLLACLLPCAQEFNESRVRAATSAVAWCGGTVNWVWPVAKGGQEILSLEHINFCFFLIELVTLVPGPTSVPSERGSIIPMAATLLFFFFRGVASIPQRDVPPPVDLLLQPRVHCAARLPHRRTGYGSAATPARPRLLLQLKLVLVGARCR